MANLNFDPVVGEEVRILGRAGLFKIVRVDRPDVRIAPPNARDIAAGALGLGTVDLQIVGSDSVVQDVPWALLQFDDEARPVRRAIEWLSTDPDNLKHPSYIVDYEIEAKNDHAGNPSIFVRFLVDPDFFYENGRPSQENIDALNEFTFEVKQILLGLGLERWIYVQTGVARRTLDVAS
jgi:hypothetical protein